MAVREDTMADDQGYDLTVLTTCGNPVIAGALREYLEAHGVQAFVQGEHHSSMLGQLGSFLIDLNVMVQERQLDEARELLAAFEEAEPIGDDQDDGEYDDDDDGREVTVLPRADLRVSRMGRNPKVAAALALVPSFGFAHFYTGAFVRGFVLAVTEVVGVAIVSRSPVLGIGLIVTAILVDLGAGATRAAELRGPQRPAANVPTARVVDRDTRRR